MITLLTVKLLIIKAFELRSLTPCYLNMLSVSFFQTVKRQKNVFLINFKSVKILNLVKIVC